MYFKEVFSRRLLPFHTFPLRPSQLQNPSSESEKINYDLILCVERCDHDFEIITTRIVC